MMPRFYDPGETFYDPGPCKCPMVIASQRKLRMELGLRPETRIDNIIFPSGMVYATRYRGHRLMLVRGPELMMSDWRGSPN